MQVPTLISVLEVSEAAQPSCLGRLHAYQTVSTLYLYII